MEDVRKCKKKEKEEKSNNNNNNGTGGICKAYGTERIWMTFPEKKEIERKEKTFLTWIDIVNK